MFKVVINAGIIHLGGHFPDPEQVSCWKLKQLGKCCTCSQLKKKKRNKTLWPPKNVRKLSENRRFWAQISLSRQEPQSLGRFFSSKSMRPSGPYLALRATDPLWWALTKGPPGWISGVVLSGGAHYQIYQGYPLYGHTMVTPGRLKIPSSLQTNCRMAIPQ